MKTAPSSRSVDEHPASDESSDPFGRRAAPRRTYPTDTSGGGLCGFELM